MLHILKFCVHLCNKTNKKKHKLKIGDKHHEGNRSNNDKTRRNQRKIIHRVNILNDSEREEVCQGEYRELQVERYLQDVR